MLHLATSSPCSRSEIYAFDNKPKENPQQFAIFKRSASKIARECDLFRLLKASFKHLSKVGGEFSSVGTWEWESPFPRPNRQMSTGGRAGAGKRNGKCGAYFNQCARGKKRQNPKRLMSEVNARFLLSKKGQFVGWLRYFLWGGET